MYEAFVYKWTNKNNGMYYIGKHKGADNDGYISSGKSFLIEYRKTPDIFYREILFRGVDRECLNVEQAMIRHSISTDGYEKIYNKASWNTHWALARAKAGLGDYLDPRVRQINLKINKLLDINTKENNFKYAGEIRTLRKMKQNLSN